MKEQEPKNRKAGKNTGKAEKTHQGKNIQEMLSEIHHK
jgi:hypothetical protein